jgi:hypothetical protein
MPPPGFGNKPRGGGNWDSGNRRGGMDHNVDWERQNSRDASNENDRMRRLAGEDGRIRGNGPSSRMGVSTQLDRPGPPTSTNLHSASASEIDEESMMNFEQGYKARKEIDSGGIKDASQQLLEDEGDDNNGAKKHNKVKPFSIAIYIS